MFFECDYWNGVDRMNQNNTILADSRQQTADSRQQTADSRQQTADSRQQTANFCLACLYMNIKHSTKTTEGIP